jgi:Leucine-rich repeat (LRR) protein
VDANRAKSLEELDLEGLGIQDLTGTEDFKGLMELNASNNNLTELDISDWGGFLVINVRNNPLTCIQISEDQLAQMGEMWMIIGRDEGVVIPVDYGN